MLAYFRLKGPPRILKYGPRINRDILVLFGAKIGAERVRLRSPITIHGGERGYSNLEIGNGCHFGGNVYLDLSAPVILGEGVSLGPGVTIMTHNRFNYNPYLEAKLEASCGEQEVRIGNGSSVKAHAVITMGVTIGENVVIAGGAVVTQDVPSFTFVGGVPAEVIREFEPSNDLSGQ